MINTFAGANIPIDDAKGGKLNMCRATEAIREEGRVETNAVYAWLFGQGRDDDVKKATGDAKFLGKLVEEYKSNRKSVNQVET